MTRCRDFAERKTAESVEMEAIDWNASQWGCGVRLQRDTDARVGVHQGNCQHCGRPAVGLTQTFSMTDNSRLRARRLSALEVRRMHSVLLAV